MTLAACSATAPPCPPQRRPTAQTVSIRNNLTASTIDGAAYGAMVGLGETYLAAFVLAMGLGEVTSGLVTTIPMVIGGLIQLISPYAVRRLGSHKTWVVGCATIQSLAFVPLIMAAITGTLNVATALLAATVYWGAGMATGAAWNTWIDTLVPRRMRSGFFAARTRTCQLAVFSAFLCGGLVLQGAATRHFEIAAYGVLFLLAMGSRMFSAANLARQTESPALASNVVCVPPQQMWKILCSGGSGRLLVYLIVVQGAVQISGPYFAPFLFKKLHVSYGLYVTLLSLVYLSKVLSLPMWGRVGRRIGAYRLLWIGGIGIVPASGLWICSQNLFWIAGLQLVAGACWAAYELGFFLMFFESIEQRMRTSVLAIYNCLNTAAWVSGAIVGGLILNQFGTRPAGYFLLFGISSVGRAAALLLLAKVPAVCVPAGWVGVRSITVRLGAASGDAPVLPSLPDQTNRQAA